jgi:xanthine dehydrogenase FAD-binding subunit
MKMKLWQQFLRPKSVPEALQALVSAPGPSCLIAGGTDLLLDLKQGHHEPVATLVDITGIPEMNHVEIRSGEVFIGAAVPVSRVAQSPLVEKHAQALVEACRLIAGPQVRNTATLGGNVAHALPAADGTIALTALDAQAEVASISGSRRMPIQSLFLGPGRTAIKVGEELISGFYIPIHEIWGDTEDSGVASCFRRIMRPQGVALPILNCAVWLKRQGEFFQEIHIAVGPGGETPFRATEAESCLIGKPNTEETFVQALNALLGQAHFRTSARRASAEYRMHILGGLFQDSLDTAWVRTFAKNLEGS